MPFINVEHWSRVRRAFCVKLFYKNGDSMVTLGRLFSFVVGKLIFDVGYDISEMVARWQKWPVTTVLCKRRISSDFTKYPRIM